MPYIGNTAGNRFVASKAATQFSGDGSTTAFTLEHAVGSDEDILVSVDGVIQEPSVAYAVSSGTTLTFTAAPSSNSGNNIFVYYLFRTVGTVSHPSSNALEATSGTFTGDLTVDTDTLHVDSTNNRVGIGTTSPETAFEVKGDGKRIQVSSDDYDIALLGRRGSSGVNLDKGYLRLRSEGTTTAVIDSAGGSYLNGGDFMVGKTTVNTNSVGFEARSDGVGAFCRDGNVPLIVNRKTSDGEVISLRQDGSTIGGIYSSPSLTGPFIGHINVGLAMYHAGNSVLPSGTSGLRDNAIDLGNSSNRFDDIYATNSTIQTSDRNEKQDIEELSEAEKRVAVVAKGLMRKFRWIDSVAEKGDNARTHFGIIAQDLQDAFTAEGLDAGDYAMFTSTTWWEKEISVDAVEADEENGIEAQDAYTYTKIAEEATEGYTEKTRLGVRYNQLLAFIISAL